MHDGVHSLENSSFGVVVSASQLRDEPQACAGWASRQSFGVQTFGINKDSRENYKGYGTKVRFDHPCSDGMKPTAVPSPDRKCYFKPTSKPKLQAKNQITQKIPPTELRDSTCRSNVLVPQLPADVKDLDNISGSGSTLGGLDS